MVVLRELSGLEAVVPPQPLHGGSLITSAFQPVFSLSHGRLVGHEALLRVKNASSGASVSPQEFFDSLGNAGEKAYVDLISLGEHLRSYARQGKASNAEWLFLNVHPASLAQCGGELEGMVAAIQGGLIDPHKLVIEVLETPMVAAWDLDAGIQRLRNLGCLIAIDDFGAGHSNFQRVFDLAPHIVKLDRHVLLQANENAKSRRIVQRMVSLLHECGTLVLMEGIETIESAHIALECDVDFVQGFFFGRPEPAALTVAQGSPALDEAWQSFDVEKSRGDDRWRESMTMQSQKLRAAATGLANGVSLAEACRPFLDVNGAEMCYLLDERGRQVGETVFRGDEARRSLGGSPQFAPLHDCDGARWSRREYFRRAMAFMNAVQLTRPYLTLQGGRMCLTASIAFEFDHRVMILCGDIVVGPKEQHD